MGIQFSRRAGIDSIGTPTRQGAATQITPRRAAAAMITGGGHMVGLAFSRSRWALKRRHRELNAFRSTSFQSCASSFSRLTGRDSEERRQRVKTSGLQWRRELRWSPPVVSKVRRLVAECKKVSHPRFPSPCRGLSRFPAWCWGGIPDRGTAA